MASLGKKKVLCLHGYGQSGKIFREKTGSFRKFLNKNFEFEIIDAHTLIEGEFAEDGVSPIYRWWFTPGADACYLTSSECVGIEESVSYLLHYLVEKDYDGIIGFSQGGVLLSIIIALLADVDSCSKYITETDRQNILDQLKFVWIFSAFTSPYYRSLMEKFKLPREDFNISVLLVAGEKDDIVPISYSKELADLFKSQYLPEIEQTQPAQDKGGKNVNPPVQPDPNLFDPSYSSHFFLHNGSHYLPLNQKSKIVYLSHIHHLSKL